MRTKNIILTILLSVIVFQFCYSQGQVTQNLNQVLAVDDNDRDNPPKSIYVKLNTSDVRVKHMKGSRVMVSGKVKLGIPNLFFLDVLIKKGRYSLFLTPDGGKGLRIEAKTRQPMVLQGSTCSEDVSYTIYVPESISSVVFENPETGDSNIVALGQEEGASFK